MATREKDNALASAGGMPPELGLCTAIVQKHRPGTHVHSHLELPVMRNP